MKNSQLSNMLLKVGCFFLLKSLYYQRLFVSLQCENPPSLSTMLKCAGRFFKAVTAPFQACFVELQFYFCSDILLIIRKMLVF